MISQDFYDSMWFRKISLDFWWFPLISGDFCDSSWFILISLILRDFSWFLRKVYEISGGDLPLASIEAAVESACENVSTFINTIP